MLKNYLKIYTRILFKNKLFTTINVIGLAVGIVTCLLLLKYVDYQTNYDRSYTDFNQIYRVNTHVSKNNLIINETAKSFTALAPVLNADFDEVVASVRFSHETCLMDYRQKNVKINDKHILWTDNSFFDVFNLNILNGDKKDLLSRPFTTVISASTAKLFFKNENPIGKIINLNGDDYPVEVTAVFDDIPENSHIPCDFLVSMATGYSKGWASKIGNWRAANLYTYVKLKKNITPNVFENKLSSLVRKHRYNKNSEIKMRLSVMPIKDIYLKSYFKNEIKRGTGVSIERIYFLSVIAIMIMIIAWVNFINLSIAKAMTRTLEIGIKKTLGAIKTNLIQGFILESIFMSVLAFIVAIILIAISTFFIDSLSNYKFISDIWTDYSFWLQAFAFMIFGSVLVGLYPAFSLSKLPPTKALKGILPQQNLLLKKSLVAVQFIAAIGLVFGTLTIYKQLTHMKNQQLGFNASNKLIIKAPKSMNSHKLAFSNIHRFRNETSALLEINTVSASRSIPGQQVKYTSPHFKKLGQSNTATESNYHIAVIDHNFFNTYDIPLLAGKNFTPNYKNHKTDVILNEKAVHDLGFESAEKAINQTLIGQKNSTYKIIGVIKDYHQQGLKLEIHPIIYRYFLKYNYIYGHYSIALNTDNTKALIPKVKAIWQKIYPNDTFEYFFMDSYYNKQYEEEDSFMNVFFTASFITILICCMGLYGLSAYTVLQRKKETAIRKIVGASVKNIFILLFKGYLHLIVISLFIAFPISYFVLESWLANYPYRITINPFLILIAVVILISVVIITIARHTLTLAKKNPSESITSS
ncbi:ABC transporter permease [uncultured Maribacter sp.]|uniref:ABC transporter permease n=1 Tax=uncultured Maribacter sp. TaxID=431308 RepID=UPI00260DE9C4|nr:ABC transporter permease [uncultured Maribacter sp.]